MLELKVSWESVGWEHHISLYSYLLEKRTAGWNVAAGCFYRGKQPASQGLHQGGWEKKTSQGQRSVYPLWGLSRPLLPTVNTSFQAMSSLALNGCGDTILSQVNLKLCWMKNGHSFCKWTAPLCPWILHPCALQTCSQHCKRSHSMNAVIPTWRVQEKAWLEDVLFHIYAINLRMTNFKLQENNCLFHILWVRLTFVVIKEAQDNLRSLEASIQGWQGRWCHIMSSDITSIKINGISILFQCKKLWKAMSL